MRKLSLIFPLLLLTFLPSTAFAYSSIQGYCTQGGQQVFTNTVPSTTVVMQSYPQCTVKVLRATDLGIATIYSNSTGTSLANPFVASATGKWQFFAADNVYNVTLSGGGIPTPFTLSSLVLVSPGPTSFGPLVYENSFPGSDCGARVNSAYAALPATGGEISVPETCSFSTQIVFGTANKPAILSSFGNATVMTYTAGGGVAITFNNGPGFDFTSSIRNVTLTGPGNATTTTGLLIGGSNGAAGFSASLFKLQSFGTVVQTASNTWITKFDHGMIRDGTTLLLEPSGQNNAGENVEFDHVTFADSPAPHTNAVWVQGGGQETVFNTCSFDQAQLRIGNTSTSSAQVVVLASHFENPNFATGGVDYPFVVMDNNNGNYLRFTDNFVEQDRTTGGPYANFLTLSGGVVNIVGLGMFSPAQLTAFAVLGNAVNVNLFGYNDLSGQTVALYGGSTTGYIQSYPGANTANSSGFNAIQGAGDLFGPAASSLIQDLAVGSASHNHTLTVNGTENINTGNLNIASGSLLIGGQAAIDNARNATLATGNFSGTGTFTAGGEVNVRDSANAAAVALYSTISSVLTREATWLGTSSASLEVVNSVGTNDLVVFQNGTLRIPHVTTGGSGGTQACFTGSFDLYSGTCGGGGGGGVSAINTTLVGNVQNVAITTTTQEFTALQQFQGPGSATVGIVDLIDTAATATGIRVLEGASRIANWNAGPTFSFEVVNSSSSNDLVVFQNGGIRIPHTPTGTTGGTQACWDGSFNLSSGNCNASNTVFCLGGGSVNVITCPGVPAGLVAYTVGLTVNLLASEGTNTGATTLNVNSLGAKNVFNVGAPMTGGEIVNGNAYSLVYDGTQFNKTGTGSGVTSINTSLTGNVTNVALLNVAETFTALQQFQGTGTVTAGIIDLNDTGSTATGIRILESATRVANWNAGPAFSFEVVNNVGTNDFVVFQNGGVRVPHVPTGTTGGTQACWDGSFNLSSGACGAGAGTVTTVGFTGGLISVANPTTTPAFTVFGSSGGIPYFSAATTWASSAAMTAHGVVIGGGAGTSPASTAAGTSGQVLTSNGSGSDPTFQNAAPAGVSAINTSLTGNVTNVAITNTGNTFTGTQLFTGAGASLTSYVQINDTGTIASGIELLESSSRIANWNANGAASFEVVNNAGTNDFIVFQNAGIRIPHVPGGSGGVAACFDSSNNLYKSTTITCP